MVTNTWLSTLSLVASNLDDYTIPIGVGFLGLLVAFSILAAISIDRDREVVAYIFLGAAMLTGIAIGPMIAAIVTIVEWTTSHLRS